MPTYLERYLCITSSAIGKYIVRDRLRVQIFYEWSLAYLLLLPQKHRKKRFVEDVVFVFVQNTGSLQKSNEYVSQLDHKIRDGMLLALY